jgi:hypothetical protein
MKPCSDTNCWTHLLALIFAWLNFGLKDSYFSYILKIMPSYIVLAIILGLMRGFEA